MSWLLSPVGAVSSLNLIGDVTVTSVASGEVLVWSGSAWINRTLIEAGILKIPTVNTQNGSYTFVLGDAWDTIHKASGGAGETYTIPANSSVAYPVGTMIAINNDGGGDLSVAITTDTLTGTDGATGTRTLGTGHMAVVTKLTSTTWKYAASDL